MPALSSSTSVSVVLLMSFWVQLILMQLQLNSYSVFNLALFLYGSLVDPRALPISVCSVGATSVTWYTSLIIEPTMPSKLMVKYHLPMIVFVLGDLALHIVPPALVYKRYWREACEQMWDTGEFFPGLVSIFIHTCWANLHDRNMDIVYAHIHTSSWLQLWTISIAAHLACMNLMYFCAPRYHYYQ